MIAPITNQLLQESIENGPPNTFPPHPAHARHLPEMGISPSTVHDLVARGNFIKPFTLIPGGRAVGWLEAEVDQWIFERKEASQQEVA